VLTIKGPRWAAALVRRLLDHKLHVLAFRCHAVIPSDGHPSDWRTFYQERAALHEYEGGLSRQGAERSAWGEAVNAWHMACGEHAPWQQCAGCGASINGRAALPLADGTRVHFDNSDMCVIAYGERWRGAAERALMAMGVAQPR
jgi:hypothetical protein